MSIPVMRGRFFTAHDREGSPQVTIISQALACQQFANMNPIGKRLFVQWGRETPYEIVGVVGDVKHDGLDQESRPTVYFRNAQEPQSIARLVIRTGENPMKLAPVSEPAIHPSDKDRPVCDVQPLEPLRP